MTAHPISSPAALQAAFAGSVRPRAPLPYSPYRVFTREDWARLRADTPMTLTPKQLDELSGVIENLSVAEVEHVYLPLSRLLNLYVQASQQLHSVSTRFQRCARGPPSCPGSSSTRCRKFRPPPGR